MKLNCLIVVLMTLASTHIFAQPDVRKKNPLLKELKELGFQENKFTACYPAERMQRMPHVMEAYNNRELFKPNLPKSIVMITHNCPPSTKYDDLFKCKSGKKSGVIKRERIKALGRSKITHLRNQLYLFREDGQQINISSGKDEATSKLLMGMLLKRPEDFIILNGNSVTDKRSKYNPDYCTRTLGTPSLSFYDKKKKVFYTKDKFNELAELELSGSNDAPKPPPEQESKTAK